MNSKNFPPDILMVQYPGTSPLPNPAPQLKRADRDALNYSLGAAHLLDN